MKRAIGLSWKDAFRGLALVAPLALAACSTIVGLPDLPVLMDGGMTDATMTGGQDATAPDTAAGNDANTDGSAGETSTPTDGSEPTDVTVTADGGDAALDAPDSGPECAELACDSGCVSPSDIHTCGTCGHDCTLLNEVSAAGLSCVAGVCHYNCEPGWKNCSGTPDDGCDTDITTPMNCGGCGVPCGISAPVCGPVDGGTSYACTLDCGPETNCGGTCANTQTDSRHCGATCKLCPTITNATATCSGGVCGTTCNAGFSACSGPTACQYNTQTDPTHCGASCKGCPAVTNGTPACTTGVCGAACNPGFSACSGPTACEYDTQTDPMHCGSSCVVCPMVANGVPVCAGGTCGVTCNSGFSTCSGPTACEYDTKTDPTHCGATCTDCSSVTNGTPACTGGVCGATCDTGFSACSGPTACEYDTLTDPAHCGSSCTDCPAVTNGTPACTGGMCGATCNTGFNACSGGTACQYDTLTDPTHCGATCKDCPAVTNGAPVCTGGVCGATCDTGFNACSGPTACQYDTLTDPTHCGATCKACPTVTNGTPTCTSGACGLTCTGTNTLCVNGGTSTCSSLLTDPLNCGACGRSCAVGDLSAAAVGCAAGTCNPVYVTNIDSVVRMASDGMSIFWTDQTSTGVAQVSAAITGGPVVQLASTGIPKGAGLAVWGDGSGTDVVGISQSGATSLAFWLANSGGTPDAKSVNGSISSTYRIGLGVAPYSSSLFFLIGSDSAGANFQVFICLNGTPSWLCDAQYPNVFSGTAGFDMVTAMPNTAWTIASASGSVWDDSGDGTPRTLVSGANATGAQGLVSDGSSLYWETTSNSIMRYGYSAPVGVATVLAAAGTLASSPTKTPSGGLYLVNLSTDGKYVYFASSIAGVAGIYYAPVGGGAATKLAALTKAQTLLFVNVTAPAADKGPAVFIADGTGFAGHGAGIYKVAAPP